MMRTHSCIIEVFSTDGKLCWCNFVVYHTKEALKLPCELYSVLSTIFRFISVVGREELELPPTRHESAIVDNWNHWSSVERVRQILLRLLVMTRAFVNCFFILALFNDDFINSSSIAFGTSRSNRLKSIWRFYDFTTLQFWPRYFFPQLNDIHDTADAMQHCIFECFGIESFLQSFKRYSVQFYFFFCSTEIG